MDRHDRILPDADTIECGESLLNVFNEQHRQFTSVVEKLLELLAETEPKSSIGR